MFHNKNDILGTIAQKSFPHIPFIFLSLLWMVIIFIPFSMYVQTNQTFIFVSVLKKSAPCIECICYTSHYLLLFLSQI
jgi:hypothetical protein